MKEKPEMENSSGDAVVASIVSLLLEARRNGQPSTAGNLPDIALSAQDAYRVQRAIVNAVGPVGGFKVANKPGAQRIMAPIFAKDFLTSPASLQVPQGERIGIELEVGFRVEAPMPARDVSDRRAVIADRLSALPVIEIVRTRLPENAGPMLKLADNQINGGLVLGAPVRDWQALSLGRLEASLQLGDNLILDGPAEVPGGDAFENFLVLEEMIEDHCGGLQPGQVVITGSLNGLPYVRARASAIGRIDGLGEVSLHLDALP